MDTALSNAVVRTTRRTVPLLPSELTAISFFVYLLGLGLTKHLHLRHMWWLAIPPALIFVAVRMEQSVTRPWTRLMREYVNLGFILAGYWSVEWFDGEPKNTAMQSLWVRWDGLLLHQWGLQPLLESMGGTVPFLLEFVYMLLYAIPPLYLAILIATGSRDRTHRFLFVVLAGTLSVYALLPFIPVFSPRVAFPGVDLPGFTSFPRILNTWVLDHMDISTSVFPSGHVGVAFSTAFALVASTPERRWLCASAFLAACIVYIATIYCRYHYAVDGLASILVVSAVWFAIQQMSDPIRRIPDPVTY